VDEEDTLLLLGGRARSIFGDVEILPRCHDLDGAERFEREQILVPGDDQVCVASLGALQDEVVFRIAANAVPRHIA